MKFIEWGMQPNTWAAKTFDPKDNSTKVELRPVTESYLRIHMPWLRKRFVINIDDEVLIQPCWGVYWHSVSPMTRNCYIGRWGWQ